MLQTLVVPPNPSCEDATFKFNRPMPKLPRYSSTDTFPSCLQVYQFRCNQEPWSQQTDPPPGDAASMLRHRACQCPGSLEAYHRYEAIEPRTIVIVERLFGQVFCRNMRSSSSIYAIYIKWPCGQCVSCRCARAEEASQASGDYEHQQHDA